jgi:hypothetical protein
MENFTAIASLVACFIPLAAAYVVREELKGAGVEMNVKGETVYSCHAYGFSFTLRNYF